MKNNVVTIAGGIFAIVLMLAIAIPVFVKSRSCSAKNSCLNQLRTIDNAKEQWALAKGKTNGEVCIVFEVNQYIHGNTTPVCPDGGSYIYNPIGTKPQCSGVTKYRDGTTMPHRFPEWEKTE